MFIREGMLSARPSGPHPPGRAATTVHLGSISRTLARADVVEGERSQSHAMQSTSYLTTLSAMIKMNGCP